MVAYAAKHFSSRKGTCTTTWLNNIMDLGSMSSHYGRWYGHYPTKLLQSAHNILQDRETRKGTLRGSLRSSLPIQLNCSLHFRTIQAMKQSIIPYREGSLIEMITSIPIQEHPMQKISLPLRQVAVHYEVDWNHHKLHTSGTSEVSALHLAWKQQLSQMPKGIITATIQPQQNSQQLQNSIPKLERNQHLGISLDKGINPLSQLQKIHLVDRTGTDQTQEVYFNHLDYSRMPIIQQPSNLK